MIDSSVTVCYNFHIIDYKHKECENLDTLFIVILVISSIIIIATTLMMEPKTRAGASFGQESNAFGKSAHQSRDKFLQKVTVIFAVIFLVSLIALLAL